MSGYVDCACRDCFEIAIGERGEAMCHECEKSGCEGGETECQSPHAYGADDLCEHGAWVCSESGCENNEVSK